MFYLALVLGNTTPYGYDLHWPVISYSYGMHLRYSNSTLIHGKRVPISIPFPNEEIRITMFSIGNNKALGLDGYCNYFFKRT